MEIPSIHRRRDALKLVAASAAGIWFPFVGLAQPQPQPNQSGQPKFSSNPFTLGVASGSPTHDSVVLWTRLLPQGFFGSSLGSDPIPVRWEVADDDKFTRVVQTGQAVATAGLAHSVHVEVKGLTPDRWYFYRFLAGGAASPIGRTRTFPAANAKVDRLRLAYASCQRWEHGYFSAYRHMREENLDVVMFLGDYIYEYPGAANAVRTLSGGWVTTLDGYRERYAQHKSDVDLQAMHAHCPWLMTWDDHEVQNDYAGLQAGASSADLSDPAQFAARRAMAYQAWYEHMPVRASVMTQALNGLRQGAEMRIYSRVPYGQLATLYLLDARQYKDPQPCAKDGKLGSNTFNPASCDEWLNPARSLLGAQQERWLNEEFKRAKDSNASNLDRGVWTVLGQQTLFGQRDFKPGPEQTLWNDGWDGYPAARKRLTDALSNNAVGNPVLLGGDVHENWVGQVKVDYANPQSGNVGVEFCGTSITSRSGNASKAKTDEWLAENPHFTFADTKAKGYGVVEFTPKSLTTTLRVVDDVTRKDTQIQTLARFEVQAGRAEVERA